jgi:signal peptidase I
MGQGDIVTNYTGTTVMTRKLFRDYGATVVGAVVIALLIRFFVIEAYRIPSLAMKPTLEPGDTIFVAKWPFGLRFPGGEQPLTPAEAPRRGDVVVFSLPIDPRRDYIKRVIGLPGDQVALRKGQVILNNKTLRLDPLSSAPCTPERFPEGKQYEVCSEPPLLEDFGPEVVPRSSVFVIGDFRAQIPSERPKRNKGWGMIPISALKGRALWVWLSIQPHASGAPGGWFPQFRFERMFRRIE